MDIKAIKNDRRYFWTNHAKYKLLQYGLSPSMVKKVLNRPERVETGIAPKTTASMMRRDGKKNKREIWVMHQKNAKVKSEIGNTSKTKIISTWIYPGVSPKGKDIYIPQDIWEELGSGA